MTVRYRTGEQLGSALMVGLYLWLFTYPGLMLTLTPSSTGRSLCWFVCFVAILQDKVGDGSLIWGHLESQVESFMW